MRRQDVAGEAVAADAVGGSAGYTVLRGLLPDTALHTFRQEEAKLRHLLTPDPSTLEELGYRGTLSRGSCCLGAGTGHTATEALVRVGTGHTVTGDLAVWVRVLGHATAPTGYCMDWVLGNPSLCLDWVWVLLCSWRLLTYATEC